MGSAQTHLKSSIVSNLNKDVAPINFENSNVWESKIYLLMSQYLKKSVYNYHKDISKIDNYSKEKQLLFQTLYTSNKKNQEKDYYSEINNTIFITSTFIFNSSDDSQKNPYTDGTPPTIELKVKEMLENDTLLLNVYTYFMNDIYDYLESEKYKYSIRLYLKRDPEIKGWEEITIDIKVQEPKMKTLLKLWKDIDNKISKRFETISHKHSQKKREQLREINKRIHIKLTNK